jgi:hypothetical protein
MPNRILREGILTSERVNSLTWEAEVFYRRLMSVVDDFGRFSAHPSLLRAALYPLKLDSVRDANMERLLALVEQASLVRVYVVAGKRYLEMIDFRQQVRAKESKYPQPPEDEPHLYSTCVADAQQVQTDAQHMQSNAHLDGGGGGGGVVFEDVDDIPTYPSRASAREGPDLSDTEPFRMFADWIPSPHLSTLAKQAGLPMPSTGEFSLVVVEFIAYWISQSKARTQNEWDHALVKALRAHRMKEGGPPEKVSKKTGPSAEKFDLIDYGNGGRL